MKAYTRERRSSCVAGILVAVVSGDVAVDSPVLMLWVAIFDPKLAESASSPSWMKKHRNGTVSSWSSTSSNRLATCKRSTSP